MDAVPKGNRLKSTLRRARSFDWLVLVSTVVASATGSLGLFMNHAKGWEVGANAVRVTSIVVTILGAAVGYLAGRLRQGVEDEE